MYTFGFQVHVAAHILGRLEGIYNLPGQKYTSELQVHVVP